MIDISEVLNGVDICTLPDVAELHNVPSFGVCLLDIVPTSRNVFLTLDLLFNPFDNLPWDQIEGYLVEPPHVHSTVPFFSWLWLDSVVPRLYHLLSASWPETRLS